MKVFPLLALLLASAPAFAAGPGVKVEVLHDRATRARIRVSNPGRRRAPFTVAAFTTQGQQIEEVIASPPRFSLARNRSREVRFRNLPSTPVFLCATASVSPSLSLQSCVLTD